MGPDFAESGTASRHNWQGSPRFSPDGRSSCSPRSVVGTFEIGAGAGTGETSALFTINLDGTGLRQLTPWGIGPAMPTGPPTARSSCSPTVFDHIGNMAMSTS